MYIHVHAIPIQYVHCTLIAPRCYIIRTLLIKLNLCFVFCIFIFHICICMKTMQRGTIGWWTMGWRYSCTNSKSRDSRRELSNSRRELSISLLEFRNSRLYPIYNSQKQTRITYFSVEKTIKKTAILVVRISRLHENYFSLDKRDIQISVNPWFSSSVILVYTRITFLLAIEKQQISVSRELLFSTREKVNFSLFSIPLDIPVLHTIYFLAPVTTPYSTPPRDPSNAFLSHPLAAPWCYIFYVYLYNSLALSWMNSAFDKATRNNKISLTRHSLNQ